VEDFAPEFSVTDRQLVQIVTAFRLLFPNLGITMTTRERAHIRDGILPLGITKVSAGVSTAVGGHGDMPSTTQFEIADHRSVGEMKRDLLALGFQPVMHDWNMKMSGNCKF
jgi:2-iminoacetate synthase